MRIVRIASPKDGRPVHGVIHEDSVCLIEGSIFGSFTRSDTRIPLKDVRLLAPVDPPNILCIGRNYLAHAKEGGADAPHKPLLFIKATTCLNHPDSPIVLPREAPTMVDYEAELVVIIKKDAHHVPAEKALDYVLGYTCGNDVSARDVQTGDGQWARSKSFDTFGCMGPWIETELDVSDLAIRTRVNGHVLQDARTSMMIFKVPHLISYLSRSLTLRAGTVLFTGTPSGCGFARTPPIYLRAGDKVQVEIEGVGVLTNPVVSEP